MKMALHPALWVAPRVRARWTVGLVALVGALAAQPAVPSGEDRSVLVHLASAGSRALEREDPSEALRFFRQLRALAGDSLDALLGLGETHLMLGRPTIALEYAQAARRSAPRDPAAIALAVRALLRARRFDEALATSTGALPNQQPAPALLAAHASALFRCQQIDAAADAYRRLLALAPDHAEAHLRLGSGLLAPRTLVIDNELRDALADLHGADSAIGIGKLRSVLARTPSHAIAHRLLGEALFNRDAKQGMALSSAAFDRLASLLPTPTLPSDLSRQFLPQILGLDVARRQVAERAMALFAKQLPKLVTLGGRHDLLLELERTTDADVRASLRGKRTFDGRVWDDVRGMGGLRAASGIEALDEVLQFGFDTLAHEIAHQVHLYAFRPVQRSKIRALYDQAIAQGRCLDYYAASNEAEYFGQGVEAFASLCKRPGRESTHGHTRFELMRVDPDLHDFILELVDNDPLFASPRSSEVLAAAIEVALECGRAEDARVAADLLESRDSRYSELCQRARAAALRAISY